jgi:hypothetical protein
VSIPYAIGAIAVVYAAFAIYRRQEGTRRQLARPLVAVRHRVDPTQEPFVRWIGEIRNESDTALNIERAVRRRSSQIDGGQIH